MYRAVREAVQIGHQPPGPSNINRCMEWGNPRVPILTTVGAFDIRPPPPPMNPCAAWSKVGLDQVKEGKVKRIKYWDMDNDTDATITASGSSRVQVSLPNGLQEPNPCKRLKTETVVKAGNLGREEEGNGEPGQSG